MDASIGQACEAQVNQCGIERLNYFIYKKYDKMEQAWFQMLVHCSEKQ